MKVARAFAEATCELEDAMLLVTPSGQIVAANRAARAEFVLGSKGAAIRLDDIVQDGTGRLADFLKRCSGSKEPTPSVLTLCTQGGCGTREFRCDGALYRPEPDEPPLLRLRLRPKETASQSFALLTRQLDELNREIDLRKRNAAELNEALRAQNLLLRELQHRVRNTIQLFLSLLNREGRRAGQGAVDIRALAARFHAVGFVQKQVGSAADLSRVEVSQLVRDIVGHWHPPLGLDVAFQVDVEPVELTVEIATPLALLLNECLAKSGPRTAPVAGDRVEGRRISPERLVLSIMRPGAADSLSALVRDQFIVMLTTQLEGSMTYDLGCDMPRLSIELPIPGNGQPGSVPG